MTKNFRLMVFSFRLLFFGLAGAKKECFNMSKRHYEIVQWVNLHGRQTIQSLADEFKVSVQTIRADIRALAEQGLVLRSHGEVIPFPHRENISYDQRQIRNVSGKRHIAELCAAKITDYQSVFLGSGSTVAEVSRALMEHKGLQIMTSNLHAARHLCASSDCELTIAGGHVRKRDQDVIGGDAMRFFQRYRAEVGVVSVGSVDRQGRLYDYNDDEVMAREALISHCAYRILVIDSAKFDTESRCVWGQMSDYHCVITDKAPEAALLSRLLAAGVEVVYLIQG